ncbi:hypothetical protein LINPERHAP1_LOCUS38680 [Linum perenne]
MCGCDVLVECVVVIYVSCVHCGVCVCPYERV